MIPRRAFLAMVPAALAAACKRGDAEPASCSDTTGLAAADAATRATLGYADRSPDPAKTCALCTQFVAPAASGACGACKLLKGPIHPRGSCKAFAPRA